MKGKLWLYPLILIVSVIMLIISFILPFFEYVRSTDAAILTTPYGIFENFGALNPILIPEYTGIWGTLSMVALIIGALGLITALVLTILKLTKTNVKNYRMWNNIATITALVGLVALIVFSALFTFLNHVDIAENSFVEMAGTTGLYVAIAGLLIGICASFLSANDIIPKKAKAKKSSKK